MDRITESLLNEFSQEHELDSLAEDKRFEHFAAYLTVRRHHSETFDSTSIVTGSGSDTGIDAIAILVNGTLITDVEEFTEHEERSGTLDVTFIFVQADRGSSFEGSKIGQFQYGVVDFFQSDPKLPRNAAIVEAAAIMEAIYSKSSKFTRGNPICRLFYVTTGRWQSEPQLEARRVNAQEDVQGSGLFREVEFSCIGADGLQRLYNQSKHAISREFTFADRAVVPEVDGVSEAYLGFIPAPIFLSIVTDENGDVIKGIFYDNVRDWQDYNPVNAEIAETLSSKNKNRFVLMNNGVTIIARTVRPTGNRFYIEDFQVVNGCQTSHVLSDHKILVDESVMVPMRLIGTQDEDVISSIIKATNRQTEVKPEQFLALTDFAKKLELYFQSFSDGRNLYYERRSHQYDSQSIEKTRIVTPGNLIRSYAAMFLEEPHATTRSYRSLSEKVGKEIFVESDRLEPYYASAFALYKLEFLFRNQRLAPEYKPARFHILLAFRLLANPSLIPPRNSRELERYCRVLMDVLWDGNRADELLGEAAQTVEKVAAGDFHRDNIRTITFTGNVLQECWLRVQPDSQGAT
jgi:hypothetical protein